MACDLHQLSIDLKANLATWQFCLIIINIAFIGLCDFVILLSFVCLFFCLVGCLFG